MRYFPVLAMVIFTNAAFVYARSSLLESVKQNPEEARVLCKKLSSLNEEGISTSSAEAIKEIARKKNLSVIDAEILMTYVIGLNCPDVR